MRQREAVLDEKPLPVGLEAVALLAVREVVEPDDQRRIGDDAPLAVDVARELRERLHVVAAERLGDGLVEALAHLAADLRAQLRHQLLDLEAGVPDLEIAHPGELRHPRAVGGDRLEDDALLLRDREAAAARADQHAHREPLDVPLPRARQRLVEVVDVEDEPSLGRGVEAEVREVGVAAALDDEARCAESAPGRPP